MNARFAAVMAFYGYLTLYAGPRYLGTPQGYIAGAAASYALYETVGREFSGY
jgi:hypothetical protein